MMADGRAGLGFNTKLAKTGMSVNAKTSADPKAKTIAKATGANSLPSKPSSVRRGKKTRQIMSVPAAVGTATSVTAR